MYMNMAFDNVCFKGSIVSPSARFVYMCLCKHADSTMQTCFPSLSRIAEIVGKSISTVKRAVRELCKYGAIERNPRFRKDGGQTSNLYKVAQVDLGSLTKVSDNIVNEETEPEQIENKDITTKNICFSESNNEPACACTTMDSEIKQKNTIIEESIDNELENDIQNTESSSAIEFAEFRLCTASTKQQKIEITKNIHRNSMSNFNKVEYINTDSRPTNRFNVLNLVKRSVINVVKTISTKILHYKIHSFSHSELGGGHRRSPKNLSN